MSDYICILANDVKLTCVTEDGSRMWKHVNVVLNCNLRLEVWSIDGECKRVSTAISKMDLEPAKGSRRIITKSGARYYW